MRMLNWRVDGSTAHRQEHRRLTSTCWTHEHRPPQVMSPVRPPHTSQPETHSTTLGTGTSIRVSHELHRSSVTFPLSSSAEQYTTTTTTTTTHVSATKFQNRHAGDHPVNIVGRSNILIALEMEKGKEIHLGRGRSKVKWGRDPEDTKNGQNEGKFILYGTISPGEEVLVSD